MIVVGREPDEGSRTEEGPGITRRSVFLANVDAIPAGRGDKSGAIIQDEAHGGRGFADGKGILSDEEVVVLLVAVLEEMNTGSGELLHEAAQEGPAVFCGAEDQLRIEDGIEDGKAPGGWPRAVGEGLHPKRGSLWEQAVRRGRKQEGTHRSVPFKSM